jgi:hypothetical protein
MNQDLRDCVLTKIFEIVRCFQTIPFFGTLFIHSCLWNTQEDPTLVGTNFPEQFR